MPRANYERILDSRFWMLDGGIRHPASSIQHRIVAKKNIPKRGEIGFALYEVLLGVTIFVVGVLALGHSVENCLNASALSAEENRVRQILSNRMAEIQTTPGPPDAAKEFKIDTGYGGVKLVQKAVSAGLKEDDGTQLNGVVLVTLTAQWTRAGAKQSRQMEFYVYRVGEVF
jgi:Tfp pilus assembly protein PilV